MRCFLGNADRLCVGSIPPSKLAEQGVDVGRGATILGCHLGHLAMLAVDHPQDAGMFFLAYARHRRFPLSPSAGRFSERTMNGKLTNLVGLHQPPLNAGRKYLSVAQAFERLGQAAVCPSIGSELLRRLVQQHDVTCITRLTPIAILAAA